MGKSKVITSTTFYIQILLFVEQTKLTRNLNNTIVLIILHFNIFKINNIALISYLNLKKKYFK